VFNTADNQRGKEEKESRSSAEIPGEEEGKNG